MTRERKTKLFPWQCPKCLKGEVRPVTIEYTTQVKHDGSLYEVNLPELVVPRCSACNELVFSNHTDEQISRALRDKLELLQPDEIRARREGLHLTQKVLAQRIGVAPETISRWESGLLIQSRAMNTLLRLFFEVPEARGVLGAQCGTLGFLDSLADWTAEASLAYTAVLEPIPQLSGIAPGQGGFARVDRLWDGLLVDPKTFLPAMTGFPVAGTVTFDVAVSPQWPIVGEGDRLAAAASEVLAETSSRIAA